LTNNAILRQSAEAVAFLHRLTVIHRNIKPTNFLIAQVAQHPRAIYVVKLDDIGRNLRVNDFNCGTLDPHWTAPEMLTDEILDLKMDVFVLGCYFYFVLTKGKHPFGSVTDRLTNVTDEKFSVYDSNWNPGLANPLANQLIKKMIQKELKQRPSMEQVLIDEFFEPTDYECYDLYEGYEKPGLCVIFSQNGNPQVCQVQRALCMLFDGLKC